MNNIKILDITAREILDSRGNPTVSTKVVLSDGGAGSASVPSGASTGSYEAKELRDGDKERFGGKGVLGAVKNVETDIRSCLTALDDVNISVADLAMINLDGTDDKSKLGANATLSVSLALARALADSGKIPLWKYLADGRKVSLPVPMMNILNGGAHASNNVDIQEFMIVPVGFSCFSEALRAGCEIYRALGSILRSRAMSTAVGDEGGFAPDLDSDEDAIELICEAIIKAGYNTDMVKISLDAAASEWRSENGYILPKRGSKMSADELIDRWDSLSTKYPILSIEDGLGEDDADAWKEMTDRLGKKIMLVGDDLFVTNEKRFIKLADNGAGNSILVKPNQIGTLSETIAVVNEAHRRGYSAVISHRSGETDDAFISDLAVALGAGYIKAGAPCRGERVAKYNRLLEIESEIFQ